MVKMFWTNLVGEKDGLSQDWLMSEWSGTITFCFDTGHLRLSSNIQWFGNERRTSKYVRLRWEYEGCEEKHCILSWFLKKKILKLSLFRSEVPNFATLKLVESQNSSASMPALLLLYHKNPFQKENNHFPPRFSLLFWTLIFSIKSK